MAAMAGEYSVREIDAKLAVISDTLERIEAQTTKTNGRVASLEGWQNGIKGGLAILALIVVPIGIYVLTHWPS